MVYRRAHHNILCQSIVSTSSSVSPYIMQIHRVYLVIVLAICCPHRSHVLRCGQSVSRYCAPIHTVHIIIYCVSRHMLAMWSECLTIYCIDSYCSHSLHVSQYIAHVVRVYHHILAMWSERLTIYCIDSYCSHSPHVSQYIGHVVRVLTIYCIDSYCSHSLHVSPYIGHVVRVYHHILYRFILFT